MKARRSKSGRLAKSFRLAGGRFSLIAFTVLAIGLLIVSRLEPRFLEQGRSAALDAGAPVLDLVAYPVSLFNRGMTWTENLIYTFRENQRLREETKHLTEWQAVAHQLRVENARLRALLQIKDIKAHPVATGRVIGQSSGNFVRSLIINVGSGDGVARGNMVADVNGVIGRVISVGRNSSRVLLLTDLNSRIPVKVLPSDVNAILAGNNDERPMLIFVPGGVTLNVGDWVVTTGHGGVFPPNMPIGRISSIPMGGDPRVQPAADFARLDYVRVFAYDARETEAAPPVDLGMPPVEDAVEREPAAASPAEAPAPADDELEESD